MTAARTDLATLASMTIPRLVAWGRSAIDDAGSFHSVRDIRNHTESLRVLLRAQGASLDAVNAATQLRLRAERRMGEMLATTEKANGGDAYARSHGVTEGPATYAEIGISKMQASRAQKIAAIPSDTFEAILESHVEQRAPVTTAAVLHAAERAESLQLSPENIVETARNTAPTGDGEQRFWNALGRASTRELTVEKLTGEYEWNTPAHIIEAARRVLGEIDLDPASNAVAQRTVRANKFHTLDDDGLTPRWSGRVWMNPPYASGLIDRFVGKFTEHYTAGDITAGIILADNRTDTKWFHAAATKATACCFTVGRIHFIRPTGETPGTPTNGSVLIYFGADLDLFRSVFSDVGLVMTA